jgi:hypothetical protein
LLYIFYNAIERTKHGDRENKSDKVPKLHPGGKKTKQKNEQQQQQQPPKKTKKKRFFGNRTRGSGFNDQCVNN